jgi:hypothetical protein
MASTLAAALAGVSGAGAARADELVVPKAGPAAAEAEAKPPAPPADWMNYNARPLTLAAGMLGIHGDVVSDISSGRGGKPVWITPNIYYGVTDTFTIGVAENVDAEFFPIGGGLCLGGKYCDKVLNNVSVDLLLSVGRTPASEIALHAGADINAFSPLSLDVRGGAWLKFALAGPLALMGDPSVSVWVLNPGPGKQEFVNIPLRLGYQVADQVNVGLATGMNAYINNFSNSLAIPVGLGALLTPNPKLDVGLNFTLTNVGGHHDPGLTAFSNRTVALTVNYRL